MLSQSEELRRQTSCLLSMKDEGRPLCIDEVEDAIHTLMYAEKVGDVKAQNICLELIHSSVPMQILNLVKNVFDLDTLKRIASKGEYGSLSSNKLIASDLLKKLEILESNDKSLNPNDTMQR